MLGGTAEHQLDDAFLRTLGYVDDAHRLAFPEHGGAVADCRDLDHAVRYEDDGAVSAALTTDDVEDTFGQVCRQCRGHLVEHQHIRLDGEGAGQVDDPERGER